MLIQFTIQNYKSYKHPQHFTMVPGKYRLKKNHVITKKIANILKFCSIYGGNASGKSNLVDGISRTRDLIVNGEMSSYKKQLFFKLDSEKEKQPSNFEYKILVNDRIFVYGLSVSFYNETIYQEYLYELKNDKEILYFDLDYKNNDINFNFDKIKEKANKKKIEVYIDDFTHNEEKIFINYLDSIKFKEEGIIYDIKCVFQWFKSTLTVLKPNSKPVDIIGLFNNDSNEEVNSIIDLIKSFDTGITDFVKKTLSFEEFKEDVLNSVPINKTDTVEGIFKELSSIEEDTNATIIIDDKYFKAYKKEKEVIFESLKFEHCNKKCAEFDFGEESDGSRRVIELVNLLYSAQFKNRVFIVDELNRSLHPNLTVDFIEKFITLSQDTESQLIVTNHDSALMDFKLVRQDEIWIVDRDIDGSSNLISLDKFNIRSDKVLNKDYLNGRYGGIPQIYKLLSPKREIDG